MSELLLGAAKMWFYRSRSNWKSWDDFCREIRIAFDPDRRMQERLVMKDYRRTQGLEEPVRHYIECILAIVGRINEPRSEEKTLDLLHRNMLPALHKQVNRCYVNSIKDFYKHAYEA